jgi:gluconate/galactonate dehydratase
MVASPRDVEITDVQTVKVDGNFPWTLVRVYTDAGVVGTGEAYLGDGAQSIIEKNFRGTVVGENPCDIDRLYGSMVRGTMGRGAIAGETVTAAAGIEVALHDLAGKLLDVPAHQLLGGKYRDDVRVYVDCHAGAHLREDEESETDIYAPEAYAAAAESVVAEGYDALKFDLDATDRYEGDEHNRHLNAEAIDYKASIVEAATEAVAGEADVAFDCHWNYTGDSAIRLARAIEEYDVLWLEDVIPPENHDVQREVTRATETPICTGENVYRKHGVRQLIEEQAVDVVQPDMPRFGGMRETSKAADAADTYYIPMALHNVSSPVGTMAGAHVASAVPNFLAIEYHSRELDWWGDLVEETVIEDGTITVPDGPGLGVTLDMDAVEAHMAEGETLFDEA